jgi:CubicO group peptidase (beta-lactamase class C family)
LDFQTNRASVIDRHAQRLVESRQFAGVAWCIEHRGAVVAQGAAGHRDADAQQPLAEDTLYRLYSMTKPVVSVLCLQLIEAGLLQLDDSISRWLPAFGRQQVLGADGSLHSRQRAVTIEDLLTHRSGLSYDFQPDCAVADEYRAAALAADGTRSLQELAQVLAGLPLAWQPGERWYYGYGTDVLASVIECVTDKRLASCLQEALFDPLGMLETGFQVPERHRHRLAQMFGQRDLGEVPVNAVDGASASNVLRAMEVDASYPSDDAEFARGGIGLYSTMGDYRRFMAMLMHGRADGGDTILSQPMLELSWRNRLSPQQMPIAIGDKSFPGYGWGLTGRVMVDPGAAVRLSAPGEGGWAGAASTHFWVDRNLQFSGIVMAQYLGSEITLGPDIQALAYAALG